MCNFFLLFHFSLLFPLLLCKVANKKRRQKNPTGVTLSRKADNCNGRDDEDEDEDKDQGVKQWENEWPMGESSSRRSRDGG